MSKGPGSLASNIYAPPDAVVRSLFKQMVDGCRILVRLTEHTLTQTLAPPDPRTNDPARPQWNKTKAIQWLKAYSRGTETISSMMMESVPEEDRSHYTYCPHPSAFVNGVIANYMDGPGEVSVPTNY